MANDLERGRWNEPDWAEVWPRRERFTVPVTPDLLAAAAPSPGERVLDVGTGGGGTALEAAEAVGPEGAVVGADISEPLSALARRRAAERGVANVRFEVVDVQTAAVAGAPFDVALSQFGVMFFDEPEAAFANLRRQLRAGGRLAFACWQETTVNPWFVGPAIAAYVPPPAPLPAGKSRTGPFALADAERTRALLTGAGFADVARVARATEVEAPEDAVIDEQQLQFLGVEPSDRAEALEAARAKLAPFRQPLGLYLFPIAFQIFTATNPG